MKYKDQSNNSHQLDESDNRTEGVNGGHGKRKRSKNARTQKHSDAQRGESLTSLKKHEKLKNTTETNDDCEQKGRFLIKNRTEDTNVINQVNNINL